MLVVLLGTLCNVGLGLDVLCLVFGLGLVVGDIILESGDFCLQGFLLLPQYQGVLLMLAPQFSEFGATGSKLR